jgi:hypothetical protein
MPGTGERQYLHRDVSTTRDRTQFCGVILFRIKLGVITTFSRVPGSATLRNREVWEFTAVYPAAQILSLATTKMDRDDDTQSTHRDRRRRPIFFNSRVACFGKNAGFATEGICQPTCRKFSASHRSTSFTIAMRHAPEHRMRFLLRRIKTMKPEQRANGSAAMVAMFTAGFLYLECPARPAGADIIRQSVAKTSLVINTSKPATPADDSLTPEQRAEQNLAKKIELLKKGMAFLQATPDYTAQFMKRELVNGELLEEQTMAMKVRHEPFSIYLKWLDGDAGREVMYVDGVNDGKMLVHSGTGWKSRLPAILMEPDSTLAMQEARYPVTRAGMLALADTIIGFNQKDLESKSFSHCHHLEDQLVGNRSCHCFVLEYKDRAANGDYRKSMTLIDKEWCIPLYIKNFGWPADDVKRSEEELDELTLLEHYVYTDVKFRAALTQLDSDHANEDYRLSRQ